MPKRNKDGDVGSNKRKPESKSCNLVKGSKQNAKLNFHSEQRWAVYKDVTKVFQSGTKAMQLRSDEQTLQYPDG